MTRPEFQYCPHYRTPMITQERGGRNRPVRPAAGSGATPEQGVPREVGEYLVG